MAWAKRCRQTACNARLAWPLAKIEVRSLSTLFILSPMAKTVLHKVRSIENLRNQQRLLAERMNEIGQKIENQTFDQSPFLGNLTKVVVGLQRAGLETSRGNAGAEQAETVKQTPLKP